MNILTAPKKYSGRWFTEQEIATINKMIESSPNAHRTALSKMVCKQFEWYKENGDLKDMSCRVAMIRMEQDGLIKLPAPRTKNAPCRAHSKRSQQTEPQTDLSCAVNTLVSPRLELVSKKNSHLWNEFIDRYHYLGYKPLPGAQLRYFVYVGEQLLALLGFGAAAWKTAPRDNYIGWSESAREQRLHLVVNNARFLILPWVKVPHLGSKILSLAAKRIPLDWQERYHYKPVLLETFVDTTRFKGTCYNAANWHRLGETTGRGKKGPNQAVLPIKSVWVYPLDKRFKHKLCHD